MKIGFTGTRTGMTSKQRRTLERQLEMLSEQGYTHFVYGGAIGADAEAGLVATQFELLIELRPAIGTRTPRGIPHHRVWPAKPPLDRNRDIVEDSDILLATPSGYEEELRSGTWATVRYGMQADVKTCSILPDGVVFEKNKGSDFKKQRKPSLF